MSVAKNLMAGRRDREVAQPAEFIQALRDLGLSNAGYVRALSRFKDLAC